MSANAQLQTFTDYETLIIMRWAPILASVVLAGCGKAETPQQAAAMNVIEEKVRMPAEASALRHYARFYTAAETGEIIATYVATEHNDLPVGKRRWVQDIYHLPLINDGGCFVVNVRFDPKSGKVTQAFCNGVA